MNGKTGSAVFTALFSAAALLSSCATKPAYPGDDALGVSCRDPQNPVRQGVRIRYVGKVGQFAKQPRQWPSSSNAEFYPRLREAFRQNGSRRILLFVHGFNNDAEQAADTAAQLHHAMEEAGPLRGRLTPVFFTWPAGNNVLGIRVLGYSKDRLRIDDAAHHLARFLEDLRDPELVGNEPVSVDIIAHSMGCEVVLKAFFGLAGRQVSAKKQAPNIGHVVLLAPDVTNGEFDYLVPCACAYAREGVRVFVNKDDDALKISVIANDNYLRAGRPRLEASEGWWRVCHDLDRDLKSARNLKVIDVSAALKREFPRDATSITNCHGYLRTSGAVHECMRAFLSDQELRIPSETKQVMWRNPANDFKPEPHPCRWFHLD